MGPTPAAFSTPKGLLRKAAERTVEGLRAAIGERLDPFPRGECRNCRRHCGYAAAPA